MLAFGPVSDFKPVEANKARILSIKVAPEGTAQDDTNLEWVEIAVNLDSDLANWRVQHLRPLWKAEVAKTTPEGIAADVRASVDYLGTADGGRPRATFTVGFCWGGSNSWSQIAEGHGLAESAQSTPLQSGNAFSVEPGIYLPGRFGLRVEDIVVATPDGPERLNQAPRDLAVVE